MTLGGSPLAAAPLGASASTTYVPSLKVFESPSRKKTFTSPSRKKTFTSPARTY